MIESDTEYEALTLLSTTELLDSLLLIQVLRVERHADTDTNVVLYAAASFFVRLVGVLTTVGSSLDDESTVTSRYELAENGGKFLGHLLEGSLNSFILSSIQMLHELFNRPL